MKPKWEKWFKVDFLIVQEKQNKFLSFSKSARKKLKGVRNKMVRQSVFTYEVRCFFFIILIIAYM